MIQNNLKSNIINIIINCKITTKRKKKYVCLYTSFIYQAYSDHILITNYCRFCSLCHVN